MRERQFVICLMAVLCINFLSMPVTNAKENFSIDMRKIRGEGYTDSESTVPSARKNHEAVSSGRTAEPQSAPEPKNPSNVIVPRISGSLVKELEETGMAVIHLEFALGKAEILPEHLPWIDQIHDVLVIHPDWNLLIEGHTDRSGRPEWNKKLSLLRAEAVRDELLKRNISPARLRCVGWGSERPIDTADNSEAYARNRRVELHRD